jgi:DNA polymerase I
MNNSEYLVVKSSSDVEHAYKELSGSRYLGCDTETSGFSSRTNKLISVQLSNGSFSVVVPINQGIKLGILANLLKDPRYIKVIHNAKFDLQFLYRAGYQVNNVFDSMIAEKLLTKGADQSSSLEETIYRYFGVSLDKCLRQTFADKNWDGIWTPELVTYALCDVVYLPQLGIEQSEWLKKLRLIDEFTRKMAKLTASFTSNLAA